MDVGAEGAVDPLGAVLGRFLDAVREIAPHRLPSLIDDGARALGARRSRVWLADHQQRDLVHVPPSQDETALPPLAIDGSAGGRAYVHCDTVETQGDGDCAHLWVPLVNGVDRLGLLELEVDDPAAVDRESFRHFAAVAAAEIICRGQYSDIFTRRRRRQPMTLGAELQWQDLPPSSFSTAGVAVAGMLEPAYEVSGDTFDYAHAEARLDLVILDAVGHDLGSTLIASLALGAYRNSRREGGDLLDTARLMDQAIAQQLGQGRFATGQLARLDTTSGRLRWLNAGHPPPLLVRRNHIAEFECQPRLPFGIGHMEPDKSWPVREEQLEPGDGVLFYTDGVIEAQQLDGEEFGVDRLKDFVSKAFAAGVAPNETLRRLSNAILDFHGGDLRDDATSLLLVWDPERR
ncbi:MAG: Serine phosphatase RsbU, regulator of sigma subunit [Acidimicrobiales bacterium]|nr:Serine phosphatase RsbU, regulator of sigma subunit [Acidimicrobiales bacterium]